MRENNIYSSKDVKSRKFDVFGIKLLKTPFESRVSVVKEKMPANKEVAFMIHRETDEFVYVLAGAAVFLCGARRINVQKGDCISIKRGLPHAFRTYDKDFEAISIFYPPMNMKKPDAVIITPSKKGKR